MGKDRTNGTAGFGGSLFGYDKKTVNRYIAEADQNYSDLKAGFEAEIARLESVTALEKAKSAMLQTKLNAEKERADAADETLKETEKRAAEALAELAKARAGAADAGRKADELALELSAAQDRLELSAGELDRMKAEHRADAGKWSDKTAELEASVAALKEENASLREANASLRERSVSGEALQAAGATELSARLGRLEGELGKMSAENSLLLIRLKAAEEEKSGLAARIAVLERTVSSQKSARTSSVQQSGKHGLFFKKNGNN